MHIKVMTLQLRLHAPEYDTNYNLNRINLKSSQVNQISSQQG